MIIKPRFGRKDVIANCLTQDECCFFLHIRQESECGNYVLYVFQKEGKLYIHVIDLTNEKLIMYNVCTRRAADHIQFLDEVLCSIEEDGLYDGSDEEDHCDQEEEYGTVFVRIREKVIGTCFFSDKEIISKVYDIVFESPSLPQSYVLRGSEIQEQRFTRCSHGLNDSLQMTHLESNVLIRLTEKACEIQDHVSKGNGINLSHWKVIKAQSTTYL